jgi:V8-like Glu-specific endopeptidase
MIPKKVRTYALSCIAIASVLPNSAVASDLIFKTNDSVTPNNSRSYWTSRRLQNARPLPIPKPASGLTTQQTVPPTGTPVSAPAQAPTVNVAPDFNNRLFPPSQTNSQVDELQPNNVGSAGAYFTSSRLIPLSADVAYPYRTVGKLFFTIPNEGDFVCSGAVLKPRIVLTAGHCVHGGSGGQSGFYTNFLFVPAYRDGIAPFQAWGWSHVVTTNAWSQGNGVVPNAADYAMLEISDLPFNRVSRRIGQVTGFLGFRTLSLFPNHATLLGYPGNLDNGHKMHQVTAQSFRTRTPNSVEYGSDMRGGSSGGPWIQNFGRAAVGQNDGINPGINQIIGLTSYGPVATDPLYQGSSIPDTRFVNMLNTMCNRRSGNC